MISTIPLLDLRPTTDQVRADVLQAWARIMDEGDFVRGRAVRRFEREWAAYCGTEHAVGVASGTDAIWLTLRALGIGAGDDVVLPANTFVATAEAVVQAGAHPVFADVEANTLLLSPRTVQEALTPRTAAVIAVELYGQVPDLPALRAITDAAGVFLIEDAAQAHGARWGRRRAGSFGIAGCFSFYPGKNLGAFGDGGAVVTSDAVLAERVRMFGDHGRPAGSHDEHIAVGWTSRLDTVQAAVLSAKLPHLDRHNQARAAAMATYRRLLRGLPVQFLATPRHSTPVYHQAVVRVPDRERVREALRAEGITTGLHYRHPCHLLPPFIGMNDRPLPVVEEAARRVLSLPISPSLTSAQLERVADALRCALSSLPVSA